MGAVGIANGLHQLLFHRKGLAWMNVLRTTGNQMTTYYIQRCSFNFVEKILKSFAMCTKFQFVLFVCMRAFSTNYVIL